MSPASTSINLTFQHIIYLPADRLIGYRCRAGGRGLTSDKTSKASASASKLVGGWTIGKSRKIRVPANFMLGKKWLFHVFSDFSHVKKRCASENFGWFFRGIRVKIFETTKLDDYSVVLLDLRPFDASEKVPNKISMVVTNCDLPWYQSLKKSAKKHMEKCFGLANVL